jgi:hypothetical protein
MYYKKDNARFLKVTILFSQHEHRILTGQKPGVVRSEYERCKAILAIKVISVPSSYINVCLFLTIKPIF